MINRKPHLIEVYPAASRGRNPDNPSDRTAGIETEQRLEVHTDEISNCITGVAKDFWIVEEYGWE